MLRRLVIAAVSALFAVVVAFVDGIIRDVRWQIALHHQKVTTGQVLRYSFFYAEIAVVCAAPSAFLLAIALCVAPFLLARWYIALLIGVIAGLAATVGLEYWLFYPKFPAMAANDLQRRIWPITLASALMFLAASVYLRPTRSALEQPQ
jgi:ABC-type Fe3+ transport system permease subunit